MHSALAAEAGMLWYASYIARRVPTVEAFHIHEEGTTLCNWSAKGWLTVRDAAHDHARDVTGSLYISPDPRSK